jgi:hypothetical protein
MLETLYYKAALRTGSGRCPKNLWYRRAQKALHEIQLSPVSLLDSTSAEGGDITDSPQLQ